MEAINSMREVPERGIDKIIEQTYYRKKGNPVYDYHNSSFELDQYNNYMLHDEIDDEGDPSLIIKESHDITVADLKEKLLTAVNSRKGKVLNIALQIFNKVQD